MLFLRDGPITTQRSSAVVSTVRALANEAVDRRCSRFSGIWQTMGLWLRRRNDRAMLRSLSPRDLHDFCLSQTDAETEMNKPFWRE